MLKHNFKREVIEQKARFMNSLRPEWKSIVSIIKGHEQFKNYSLAQNVGILKSHEDEIIKEAKLVTSVGSLALVTKSESSKQKKTKIVVEDSEFEFLDEELTKEDKVLMVTNPKKIFKNNFSRFKRTSKTNMLEIITSKDVQTLKNQEVKFQKLSKG